MTDISDGDAVTLLRRRLPPVAFRDLSPAYLEEPRGRYSGIAQAVLAPGTVEEAAEIIRVAAATRTPVVPFGGGTGLVGGQIVTGGPPPLVVSMERMARIRSVHPDEAVLIAEAGAILADVQAAAEAAGLLFPLSLASEGSCRIGGNLATNAGGVNVLRYGNARDLCLGLEAVLPDGSVMHGLRRLRKDNTGYDLRGLLIGSEGTLGLITAASLRLFPRPRAEATAMLVVEGPEAALKLLALARQEVGEAVSAFELIHRQGYDFLMETMPDVRLPFAAPPDWSVLIDLGFHGHAVPEEALTAIFETGLAEGLVSDGVIAASEAQRAGLWAVRENIPLANRRIGSISSHDVSLPLSALPEFIVQGQQAVAAMGNFRINCFGHVGDGNLHFNVFPPKGDVAAQYRDRRDAIKQAVHDLVHEMGGSVSAEHGIGRLKVGDLERYGDPARLAAMRAVKAALDPLNIMNPGAVLRA
ncbi:MAG: FAD-binding oxidoreductase [Rhodobacteraceae bacterium]|nr:FAD-binding oxidoreductase [Paracoccaceae bacterium]